MGVQRWVLTDPYASETYTFPKNPSTMGSIHPSKNVTVRNTTAVDGRALLFEGNPELTEWEFSGTFHSKDHYEALVAWSEKRNRLLLTDHFGRTFSIYLIRLEATPENKMNARWFHRYTMRALILSPPSAATVGA